MWVIAKYDKKKLNFFLSELNAILKNDLKTYNPITRVENFNKKKLVGRSICILNDYIFCFSKQFLNQSIFNNLRFTKGLKYFLPNALQNQNEIIEFINRCRKIEDKEGYINHSLLFETHLDKNYKFISGPFINQIFKTINLKKNKIEIMLSGIRTTLNKKKLQFTPV